MQIKRMYMKRNDCYQKNEKIKIEGIILHSTASPGIRAKDWYSLWNKSYQKGEIKRQVAVHCFLDDEDIYQYLPWDHRGWHAGGKANDSHIGIEVCEPAGFEYTKNGYMLNYQREKNETYFQKVWNNSLKLCVYLSRSFNISPENILSHREAGLKKLASPSRDICHFFAKHEKTMPIFRKKVKILLKKRTFENKERKYYRVQVGAFEKKENAEKYLKKLQARGIQGILKYD